MAEKNFQELLAECEGVLRRLRQNNVDHQDRLRLLGEMRLLIESIEKANRKAKLSLS
jgi:hypothetical protein